MRKVLKFTGTLLLAGGVAFPVLSVPTRYEIPVTQEEFETQWEIVAGDDEFTWEWVESSTPYAQISPSNSSGSGTVKGATLVYATPIEMKAGETYYLQGNVCSADYNDDERFYLVVGTDKDNLEPFKTSTSSFYAYRQRNLEEPNFQLKPADTSSDRTFTPDADGTYYIGIRSWYGSGSFSDLKLQVQALYVEKMVDYPDRVTGGSANMDSEGKLEATVSWTMPSKTKSGASISGNLGVNIYRSAEDGKEALTDSSALIATLSDLTAGEKVVFVDDADNSSTPIPSPGKYYYFVAPFNENGENLEVTSSATITLKWVGEDEKCLNPLNSSLKLDGDNIVVSFKNRMEGYNGGYLSPAKFYNVIKRSKNGGEFITIEDHYAGEADEDGLTRYVDSNLDGLGSYKYEIYAGYGDILSVAHTSPSIFGGGAMPIPFTEDFSDSSTFGNFTAESTSTYNTWSRVGENAKFSPGYSSYSTTTATLFTPPLRLEGGKTYRVSVVAWGDSQSSGGYYPSYGDDEDDYYDEDASYPLNFVAGGAPELASSTVFAQKKITATSAGTVLEAFFAPAETGNFYLGFSSSSSDNNCVYIDDISVELSEVVPATVSDLVVAPAQDGTNSAVVSFTVPSVSNAGVTLPALDKVIVNRYSGEETVEVKVIDENVTPGMAVEFSDETPAVGMCSYGVVAYLDDSASEEAKSEEKWLGYDVPKAISAYNNFSVSLNDNYLPVVAWAPLEGTTITEHGGYVDRDNLKYRVYRMDQIKSDNEPELVGETSELTFTDTSIAEREWSRFRYGVAVVNGTQEGHRTDSYTTLTGGEVSATHELDLSDEGYVESLEGRGFVAENGISWKGRGATAGTEHIAYLPPFRYVANETTGVKLDMTVSRGNAEFEELLEIYLCAIETSKPALRNDGQSNTEAQIQGQANMTLVYTAPVHAMSDSPEEVSIPVNIEEDGKYRIALRCASADNKFLTVHTLSVAPYNNVESAVEEIDIDADSTDAEYYTLQGVKVKNPVSGIYIRVKDGKSRKVMVK